MPGISIHVVDVSRGVLAVGMQVHLYAISGDERRNLVAKGRIAANGLLDKPELAQTFAAGRYLARFHVGDYYRAAGIALPGVSFLDIVDFHFGIADPAQHCHLPFKCTPWGYSCFRGGA
jgi:5-hydroxyisourate hydrolase